MASGVANSVVARGPNCRSSSFSRGSDLSMMVTARLEADRHARGIGARHAAAQHHHLRGRHTGHTAEQHTGPALLLLQAMRADLHRHATGDLAHWREQGQRTRPVGDRLVGDAGGAGVHQALGLRLVGGEVQIGEQHLTLPQHGDLHGLRLLHLHDKIGGREHLGGAVHHRGAGGAIGIIGNADASGGVALDRHLVAVDGEFANTGRRKPNTVLVRLDLLGNADPHADLLSVGQRELSQIRNIVILDVDLQGRQHAHHRIVEARW